MRLNKSERRVNGIPAMQGAFPSDDDHGSTNEGGRAPVTMKRSIKHGWRTDGKRRDDGWNDLGTVLLSLVSAQAEPLYSPVSRHPSFPGMLRHPAESRNLVVRILGHRL